MIYDSVETGAPIEVKNRLRLLGEVGDKFTYMGKEMIIKGFNFYVAPYCVAARYLNDTGEILNIQLSDDEVLAIVGDANGDCS